MKSYADLSIEAFESFGAHGEASEIAFDPKEFDHGAHIYMAWQYLRAYELGEAGDRFTSALKRITKAVRAPKKYHATISWFYMTIIAERMASNESDNWNAFRVRNPDLFDGDELLRTYYDSDILDADHARRVFVLPNPDN